MKRWAAVILIVALTSWDTFAQDGYPLPDELAVITPENAAQLERLAGVESVVMGEVAWSPDGTLLAAGTSAGVKLYDAADLTAPPRTFAGGKDVLLNPASDRLVSGGTLWDVETGGAVAEPGDSYWRQFSPSGDYLLTAHFEDGLTTLYIWDGVTGAAHGTLETQSPAHMNNAVFDTGENQVALIAASSIFVLNLHTQTLISRFSGDHSAWVNVHFTRDDQRLAGHNIGRGWGEFASKLVIVDVPTGDPIIQYELFDAEVIFSADGRLAVLRQDNTTLDLIDLSSGDKYSISSFPFNFDQIERLFFSPDSHFFGAFFVDQNDLSLYYLALWDVTQLDEEFYAQTPIALTLDAYMNSFAMSEDNRLIAFNRDDLIHIWDVQTNTELAELPSGHSGWQLAFKNGNSQLLAYSLNGSPPMQLWDVATETLISEVKVDGTITEIADLTAMQSAYWDLGRLHVADFTSGIEIVLPVIPDYLGEVRALDAVHGRATFSGTNTRTLNLLIGEMIVDFSERTRYAAFKPDGMEVLLWPETNSNLAFQKFTGSSGYRRLGTPSAPGLLSAVYSPSGDLLITDVENSEFNRWALYNTADGKELMRWQHEGEKALGISIFSPDGKLLITASQDENYMRGVRTLRLWDVEALKRGEVKPVGVLELYAGMLLDIMFSADGEQLAIALDDPEYGDGPASHYYRTLLINTADLLNQGSTITQTELNPLTLPAVYAPRFSPDGTLLFTTGDATYESPFHLALWDETSGESITTIEGYHSAVFSPDGALVVTFNSYGFALWQTAALLEGEAEPLATFSDEDVREIAFSPDGNRLYLRSTYGVEVWGVAAS